MEAELSKRVIYELHEFSNANTSEERMVRLIKFNNLLEPWLTPQDKREIKNGISPVFRQLMHIVKREDLI